MLLAPIANGCLRKRAATIDFLPRQNGNTLAEQARRPLTHLEMTQAISGLRMVADNSSEKYQRVGKKKPNPWGFTICMAMLPSGFSISTIPQVTLLDKLRPKIPCLYLQHFIRELFAEEVGTARLNNAAAPREKAPLKIGLLRTRSFRSAFGI